VVRGYLDKLKMALGWGGKKKTNSELAGPVDVMMYRRQQTPFVD
jgi:hypothetical protein